jgi:hypothetical protein
MKNNPLVLVKGIIKIETPILKKRVASKMAAVGQKNSDLDLKTSR